MFIPYFSQKFITTNKFGISNNFAFIFTDWRHHKNNLVLPTPTKNKVTEQPTRKIVPEIDITQLQQQQQQQQHEQQQK